VDARITSSAITQNYKSGNLQERRTLSTLREPEPEPLVCPVVSVDDHVVEPMDLFDGRIPSKLKDQVPTSSVNEEGVPFWCIDGQLHAVTMREGPYGHPGSEWSWQPMKFDEFRPGIVDAEERLHDMDLNGVWGSLCFPSTTWGFSGRVFSAMKDPGAGLAALRAYNEWHLERWVGAAPERFISCQLPWLRDPLLGAAEIRANATRGFVSVSFPEDPSVLGYPALETGHWDAFLDACAETGTVINLHCGMIPMAPSERRRVQVMGEVLFVFTGVLAAAEWIYSGALNRFPALRLVLTEAGISWVPKLEQRLRQVHARMRESPRWIPPDTETNSWEPARALRTNFYFASIEDRTAFKSAEDLPLDHILLEADYPHPDSHWPHLQALVAEQLGSLRVPDIRRVCFETACEIYRLPHPPASMVASSLTGRGEVGVRAD
jgi:predicted TIM-barrel fold metal-dependent hydrolase